MSKLIAVPTQGNTTDNEFLTKLSLNRKKTSVLDRLFSNVSIYSILEDEEITPNDYFIASSLKNDDEKDFYSNRIYRCYSIVNFEPMNGKEGGVEIYIDKERKFIFYGGKEKLFLTKVNGYFSDEYFEDLPILDIKIVKDFINNFNQKNF